MGIKSSSIPVVSLIFTFLAQRIQNVVRNCCADNDRSQQCKHSHGSFNNTLDCIWTKNNNKCPQICARSVSPSMRSGSSPQGTYTWNRKPIGTVLTLYAAGTMPNGHYQHSSGQQDWIIANLGSDFVTEEAGQFCTNLYRTVDTFLEASGHPVRSDVRHSSTNLGSVPGQHPKEHNQPLEHSGGESLKRAGSCTQITFLCSKGLSVEQIDTPALDPVGDSPQAESLDFDKVDKGQEFPKATSHHQAMIQVASESPPSETQSYQSRRSRIAPIDFELSLEESPSFHGLKRKRPGSKEWPASKRLKRERFHNMRPQTLQDPCLSEMMQKVLNLITSLQARVVLVKDQLTRSRLEGTFRIEESLHRIETNEWLERRATPPYSPVPRNHARTTVKWPALSEVLAPTSNVAPETRHRPLSRCTSVQGDSGGIRRKTHGKLCDHMYRVQKITRDQHEHIRSLQLINASLGRRVAGLEEQLQVEELQFRHRTREMLERARLLTLNGICQVANKFSRSAWYQALPKSH